MIIEFKRNSTPKGRMARRLVYFCIAVLTLTLLWAIWLTTYTVIHEVEIAIDLASILSAILTFAAAAFGGELLFLLLKRVFAKPSSITEDIDSGGTEDAAA